jgi:site-specific DNA recombinase
LCQLIIQPDYVTNALQRARSGDWLPQHLQARKQSLRKALAGLSQQLERLTNAYLTAIMPLTEYQRRRSELEQKSEALAAQAKELDAQVDRQAELVQLSSSIEEFCRRMQSGLAEATFEQKRTIVELLIDRVVVTDGEIEIRYVVPTHPGSERIRFCHLRKDYFDNVVQVGRRSAAAVRAQLTGNLEFDDGGRVGRVTVYIDDARADRCGTQGQLQKAFRRGQIPIGRQQKVDGVSARVDRSM